MGDVTIRPAIAETDGPACAHIYAPYVRDTIVTFEVDPPDGAEMARRISAYGTSHRWLVAEVGGDVLGYAYAGPYMARAAYDRSALLGIYLAGSACGRGVGRQLYTALIDDLAARGFHALLACISVPNEPSIALHARMGFAMLGRFAQVGWKQERWIDTVWMQRLL